MSRILLLLVFLLWMAGTSNETGRPPDGVGIDLAIFIGFYALLIGGTGLWSRMLARRVAAMSFHRSLRRFNNWMLVARMLIPAWFALAVFGLGWGSIVEETFGLGALGPIKLPSLLLGTLPPLLAWIGLWWSQYPAERTLREQFLLNQLEDGLPVHSPPTFREYFLSNLRLQILFTLVPVLLIVLTRDVMVWAVFGHYPMHGSGGASGRSDHETKDLLEFLTFLVASGLVFIFAPELLRRVLRTSPLPEGPLRRRLEAMCRRTGMRCRDILVWHTHFNMGNAAVMGIIPRVRYVLLSDLLLERMDDEQIEAVFAHEIGHVVHRHMIWLAVFFLILVLGILGPLSMCGEWLDRVGISAQVQALLGSLFSVSMLCLLLGFLQRRFERQADVYAARIIEAGQANPAGLMAAPVTTALDWPNTTHVGPYGAKLFGSALHRVAIINNIPTSPRTPRDGKLSERVGYVFGSLIDLAHDWLHGSIPSRMAYLNGLSSDPTLTGRFDRLMTRLYGMLLFAFFASATWTAIMLLGTK